MSILKKSLTQSLSLVLVVISLFLIFTFNPLLNKSLLSKNNDIVISQFNKISLYYGYLIDPFNIFNINNDELHLREISDDNIQSNKSETLCINIGNNNE